jgi:hypothetical protein
MSKRKVMIEELGGGGKSQVSTNLKIQKKTRKNHENNARHYSIPFIRAGLSGRNVSKSLHERERLPNEISHVDRATPSSSRVR